MIKKFISWRVDCERLQFQGKAYGVEKKFFETNRMFRKRIIESIRFITAGVGTNKVVQKHGLFRYVAIFLCGIAAGIIFSRLFIC